MTDIPEDGNYLVRVRAQVMSRDDSSGGWVPLGGGGLSNVSVRKRLRVAPPLGGPESSKQKHDYLIYGKRISDQSIVLSCTIKKDFEYNKVMPTFHHWKTGDKKFGLTFQTAADARAFDKGVRTAVEELLDGLADSYPSCGTKDVGDDDVFMTLNLPQEPLNSRSSSDSSSKGSEQITRLQYIGTEKPTELRPLTYDTIKGEKGENYSYVQLHAVHDYTYPVLETTTTKLHPPPHSATATPLISPPPHHYHPPPRKPPISPIIQHQPPLKPAGGGKDSSPGSGDSPTSITTSAGGVGGQPSLTGGPTTTTSGDRTDPHHKPAPLRHARCRYCQELYTPARNPPGSCEYAPDTCRSTIDLVTCIACAQCVSYHCAADAEGEFAAHPCECGGVQCGRRWTCLIALAVCVPCLWLYPLLAGCHRCGVRCGVCGGRHKATTTSTAAAVMMTSGVSSGGDN